MRLALISDIHGNLPALEAVLDDIDRHGAADAVWHLGDLVGYAPWPNEVVATISARAIGGVAGNYDSTVATDHDHCGCRYEDPAQEELARQSYAWTRAHVTETTRRFLAALPFRVDVHVSGGHTSGRRVVLVHGTPTRNTVYWTAERSDAFCLQMAARVDARPGDVIAFGHTHLPWHRTINGIHLVNTGSVGRPKDHDWRAGYTLLSLAEQCAEVEHRRVEYDLERAVAAIEANELPDEFAAYLRSGGASLSTDREPATRPAGPRSG